MYYILDQKDPSVILLADDDRGKLVNTLLFRPDLNESMIKETNANETIVDFKLVTTNEAKRIADEKEQDRINNLKMTALDFVQLIYKAGVSVQSLKNFLDTHVELDMQLKYCQNVYCGVVRQLVPLEVDGITITEAMVIKAFEDKNMEGY